MKNLMFFNTRLIISGVLLASWISYFNPAYAADNQDYDTSATISIGGAVTEIIYNLGLQKQIIAVDTTSVHPPAALATKPNVGYMRRLSAEGILSLKPTLILAIDGAGPPDVLEVLKKSSVPVVIVPNNLTEAGVAEKIRFIARIFKVPNKGEVLATRVERDFAAVAQARTTITEYKSLLFILSLRDNKVLAAGEKTAAESILGLAGAKNSISGFNGYKPLNNEALLLAAPDAIMMMKRRGHEAKAEDVFSLTALSKSPAAKAKAFLAVDGALMLGFGPRTPKAARDLGRVLYPNIPWPALETDQPLAAN